MTTTTSPNLEDLRARLEAFRGAKAAERQRVDPVKQRLMAVADELAKNPKDERLVLEYTRLSRESRPEMAASFKRIEALTDQIVELEKQVRLAEQAELDRISLSARKKAVAAHAAMAPHAKAWDDAAVAFITATQAFVEAQRSTEGPTNDAAASYITEPETALLAYSRIGEAARGHTGAHAAAVAAVVARVLKAAENIHLKGLVDLNPYTPVPLDATMAQAVDESVRIVSDVLRVTR